MPCPTGRLCQLATCALLAAELILGGGFLLAADVSTVDPAWLHLYVRNRRQAVGLEAATEFSAAGRSAELLPQIQWLLDQPQDSWTITADGQLKSVRTASEELLAVQPDDLVAQYRRQFGPTAALEFVRAIAESEPAALLEVQRRFAATDAGLQAADVLLARWLDEGAWQRAAELGLRTLRLRTSREPSLDFVRRTWQACQLAGRADEAVALEPRLAAAGVLAVARRETPSDRTQSRWLGPGGDARRTARVTATPPLLEPLWQQPLVLPAAYPKAAEVIESWLAAQRERDQPSAIGWTPVLAGRHVVFRSLDSIVAVNTTTGEEQWRHHTRTGLGGLLTPRSEERSFARRLDDTRWEAGLASSLIGGISTDGRRVYALDQTELFVQSAASGTQEQRELSSIQRRQAARNVLLALSLGDTGDAGRVAWSSDTGGDRERWVNHAFLGPPLPVEGWLYVISESDRELCVSALEAETGRLIWQQPIAVVETSVVQDRGRSLRACLPTMANGLVICPTQIGLLVAVDALTGQLRWVHNSLAAGEQDSRLNRFRPTLPNLLQQRHPGFAPLVHVMGERAVFLPSHEQRLTCISTATGRTEWSRELKQDHPDAEYIGAVTDSTILVVGRMVCRGVSLLDGSEQWQRNLPGLPSGFGVPRGESYILPLADGRIVDLDVGTGALRGYHFQTAAQPLGHLVATPQAILSVGALGVTAYPQAAVVKRQIEWENLNRPADPQREFRLAAIQLTEADLALGIRSLEQAVPRLPAGSAREQAEQLLRQAYFQAIANDESAVDEYLARLRPLCRSPQDEWQWQVTASHRALMQGRLAEFESLVTEMTSRPLSGVVAPAPEEPGLLVSPRAWLRSLTEHATAGDVARNSVLTAAAQDRNGPPGMAAAHVLDGGAEAASLRLDLARAAIDRGDWHQAECLLLRDAAGADAEAAARACRGLASLYENAGLLTLAGRRLGELATRYASLRADDGRSYGEIARSWPARSGARAAWERQPFPGPAVQHATITVRAFENSPGDAVPSGRWSGSQDRYAGYQRPVLSPPRADAAVEWLVQHRERQVVFGAFDRCSSFPLGEYVLPFNTQPPSPVLPQDAGQGLPFGLPAELRMLSPLQGATGGLAWSATLPGWQGRSGQPQPGPATPRFAVMQLKNELALVDSADGQVLWSRSDLPSGSGLSADARNGLSLDDDFVVVLESGRTAFRVYSTQTGRLVRQGSMPTGVSLLGQPRGRLLAYRTTDGQPRLFVWDPATNERLVESLLRPRQMYDANHPDRIAWVTPNYRLQVFDYRARKLVVDLPLSERDVDRASSLRCFEQSGRYFVSLTGESPTTRTEHFSNQVSESLVPVASPIGDELLAIDPQTQRVLWQRSQPRCSVVQWGDAPVPVLVMISSMRDRRNPNRRWLQMELVDVDTGLRVAASGELPLDALLTADYDGAAGSIRLLGRRHEYELKLYTQPPTWERPTL